MKNIKIYLTKMIKRMKKFAKMKSIKTNSAKIKVSSQILLNQLNILNTESNFWNHTHVVNFGFNFLNFQILKT